MIQQAQLQRANCVKESIFSNFMMSKLDTRFSDLIIMAELKERSGLLIPLQP